MDGVITNFIKGVGNLYYNSELHNNWRKIMAGMNVSDEDSYDVCKLLAINPREFWAQIDQSPIFWYNLRTYKWTRELVEILQQDYEVIILTSPSRTATCHKQKVEWLQDVFDINFRNYILCPAQLKNKLANKDAILIDDSTKNVESFRLAGGDAILFPQPWNKAYDELGMEYSETEEYSDRIISYIEEQLIKRVFKL